MQMPEVRNFINFSDISIKKNIWCYQRGREYADSRPFNASSYFFTLLHLWKVSITNLFILLLLIMWFSPPHPFTILDFQNHFMRKIKLILVEGSLKFFLLGILKDPSVNFLGRGSLGISKIWRSLRNLPHPWGFPIGKLL